LYHNPPAVNAASRPTYPTTIHSSQAVQGVIEWGTLLPASDLRYPYFAFVPNYDATLPWDGSEVALTSSCFQELKARLGQGSPRKVHLTASGQASEDCSELYMFATVTNLRIAHVFAPGNSSFSWEVPRDITASEEWCVRFPSCLGGFRSFRDD
jgi:hypothetical protein